MKRNKNIVRLGRIVLGLFGITYLLSSCAKEVKCDCITTYAYTGDLAFPDTVVVTFDTIFAVTTKGVCDEIIIEDEQLEAHVEELNSTTSTLTEYSIACMEQVVE